MALVATVMMLAGCVSAAGVHLAESQVFFVGGSYVAAADGMVLQGAIYVERLRPQRVSQTLPLVLLSGTAQTAVNWMTTPDGREGWAQFFVDQGYEVYLVDQPARGRSAWHPGLDGELRHLPVATIETLFTTSAGDWPQAKLHTQWPGTGRRGDPSFDQFYASQVEYVGSNTLTQSAMARAGIALMDRIGPAVLVTHSQAGPFGWLIADARPHLVKAVVAVEPQGPPIQGGNRKTSSWGLSDVPLTYEPVARESSELLVEEEPRADGPDLLRCWRQKEPARKLANLGAIPVVVVGTEASYHAQFDHCTVKWLAQAGVAVQFVRLGEEGIHGNGHMVMLEKNNLEVAALINKWIGHNVH